MYVAIFFQLKELSRLNQSEKTIFPVFGAEINNKNINYFKGKIKLVEIIRNKHLTKKLSI